MFFVLLVLSSNQKEECSFWCAEKDIENTGKEGNMSVDNRNDGNNKRKESKSAPRAKTLGSEVASEPRSASHRK
jgi:hypothetical protein